MKTRILLPAALLLAASIPAAAAAVVSLIGPGAPVSAGSTINLDVTVSGVADLASYQFDVGFNPLLVQAISVTEGPFLPTAGPTLFIPGFIDNTGGTVSFNAGALVGFGPGATGNGVLVSMAFLALAPGTADFSLLSPLLYDSIPNPIDVSTSGVTVSIEEAEVPEPASWLTAALALFGMLTAFRSRAQD